MSLHEEIAALAKQPMINRRRLEPDDVRPFRCTMRNDFLTPRGTPYKWQEVTAAITRTPSGAGLPALVPVRYTWDRLDARTGSPKAEGVSREWTFARGQSFTSVLMHAELAGDAVDPEAVAATPLAPMDISYPELPKAPAVDLLLMLSWDVVTFEMLCTHLITTPELATPGGWAELDRISGSWAELQFSDPDAVAVFRNAHATARHLGYGTYAGRPSAVYTSTCLDCVLDVTAGPVRQRGRSSYWITLQADAETGDLLFAEMTEMIVATLTGADGSRVPVQKRRTVRMFAGTEIPEPVLARPSTAEGSSTVESVPPVVADAPLRDGSDLAEAVRLTGRVADHLTWQVSSLQQLPAGMAELTMMGFRSVVGADLPGTYRQVRALQAGLRAAAGGDGAIWPALPEHRRGLEGLLAFGQFAADGADRLLADNQPGRDVMNERMRAVRIDLTGLLALLDRLAQPGRTDLAQPARTEEESPIDRSEGQP